MAKNLGTIVGALAGGMAGFFTAKRYESALTAALGAGAYAVPIIGGALALGYIGKRLYNSNK